MGDVRVRHGAAVLLAWIALSLGTWAALSTYSDRTLDYVIFADKCRARGGLVTALDRGLLGPKNGECRGVFDHRMIGTQDGRDMVRAEADPA